MEYSTCSYEGKKSFGRFDGHGAFYFEDGSRYEGGFQNGEFHGEGTLYLANGKVEGTWKNGVKVSGTFTFCDGLEYQDKWDYCSEKDRRFHSERLDNIIKPAGQLEYYDKGARHEIPDGCYDAGDGIFDAKTGVVSSYEDANNTRQANIEEVSLLASKAIKGGPLLPNRNIIS